MRLFRFVALLIILITGAACGTSAATGDTGGAEPTTVANQPTAASENDNIVARVNGEAITRAEFNRELERQIAVSTVADRSVLERQVLEILIEQTVINQAADELGLTVSNSDVEAEIAALKSSVASEADWQGFLQINGYTEAEMFNAQRDSLTTQRVRDHLMANFAGAVEQVNARHILVRSADAAQAILDRLNNGAGFAQLAAEFSIDSTTRDNGGDLGWFTRSELVDGQLAQVAFDLQPGQIAGPVHSNIGYHIIQTMAIEKRPVEEERLPFLAENVFTSWLEQQFQAATIERFI